MHRVNLPLVSSLLGLVLLQSAASAQPDPTKVKASTYTVEELERFIGGRTLVTIDLKDATLEQIGQALSESSGVKIEPRPPGGNYRLPPGARQPVPPPELLYSATATKKPFWEAIRDWQLAAARTFETEKSAARDKAIADKRSFNPLTLSPRSFSASQFGDTTQLLPGNALASGRAVSAWPYFVVARTLRRVQQAGLTPDSLAEIEPAPTQPALPGTREALAPPKAEAPKPPSPEEKRWNDQLVLVASTFVDPKVTTSRFRCEVLEAVDEKGNDLRLPSDRVSLADSNFSGSLDSGTPLQISLQSKPGMGKRLVKLRGVLRFNVITRVQHWETTDPTTPIEDTLKLPEGDFKISFGGLKPAGEGYQAEFTAISRGKNLKDFWMSRFSIGQARAGRSLEESGILNFSGVPTMHVVDADGKEAYGRGSTSSWGIGYIGPKVTDAPPRPLSPDVSPVPPDVEDNWQYTERHDMDFVPVVTDMMVTPKIGKAVKLIVDFPIERREISVPFEFDNLPLPPS